MAPPFKDMEEVIRLYREGLSLSEIGRRQDPPVTKQAVFQALRRRGIIKK
jgi:predicted DNA-binding protein YlxM (UPF0122 family)